MLVQLGLIIFLYVTRLINKVFFARFCSSFCCTESALWEEEKAALPPPTQVSRWIQVSWTKKLLEPEAQLAGFLLGSGEENITIPKSQKL